MYVIVAENKFTSVAEKLYFIHVNIYIFYSFKHSYFRFCYNFQFLIISNKIKEALKKGYG